MKQLFFGFLFCAVTLIKAQLAPYDTIRVMTYNTLNYGFPSSQDCPNLLTDSKNGWLRTILRYTAPDILGLEKMDASPKSFTSDSVIINVLDEVCGGCYGHTPYTNNSGYEKENMLYYKTEKIGWSSTTTIYSGDTNISDINLHRLFYKSPSLAQTHDTVFLNIILVHLESGSGNAAERAIEISGAMSWLNSHITNPGNYIFMGDFNTQSSSESCFQQIINSSNPNTLFFDPVNQLGDWDADPSAFANYLTQSTRTTDPGDCGATGGLDDRFDHILCTRYIMDGTDSLAYLSGTFEVIGQDGQHVNKSLIAVPQNESVPDTVLNALYYMSEHLPVMLKLGFGGGSNSTGIVTEGDRNTGEWLYNSLVSDQLLIRCKSGFEGTLPGNYVAEIYNMEGEEMAHSGNLSLSAENVIGTLGLADGVYLLRICAGPLTLLNGKFVKASH